MIEASSGTVASSAESEGGSVLLRRAQAARHRTAHQIRLDDLAAEGSGMAP